VPPLTVTVAVPSEALLELGGVVDTDALSGEGTTIVWV
jgi:hypothetical protein